MAHQLFENQLDDVNRRLKIAKTGVTLIQKGNSLYARGTFPPKPGSKKPEPHQQEIALKVKAVPAGLKEAEAKAKEISSALVLKKFDWSTYSARPLKTPDQRTVTEWIVALEQDYFERRKRTPESECTWRSHYREYLRRLPQTQSLTLNLLERAVRQTKPDSCTRAAMSLTCGTLGKFAGFDVTGIKALKGRYSSLKPARRDLPTDEMIVQAICQIPDNLHHRDVLRIIGSKNFPQNLLAVRENHLEFLGTLHHVRGCQNEAVCGGNHTRTRRAGFLRQQGNSRGHHLLADCFDLGFQFRKVRQIANGFAGVQKCAETNAGERKDSIHFHGCCFHSDTAARVRLSR